MGSDFSRRGFLRAGAAAGGGLLIGMHMPRARAQDAARDFTPNAFLRIAPDNTVTLIMRHTEFGQGVYTSGAMLIAEELGIDPQHLRIEPAPPDEKLYADALAGEQSTGGSTTTMGDYDTLRQAGATARHMLITAAAQRFGVPEAACRAADGAVHTDDSARSLTFGALAQDAARVPVPKQVALKQPAEFRVIGKPQNRVDGRGKVDGSLRFGIDLRVPGMKIGTVAACPVRGGTLAHADEAAARNIPGVRDVVLLDDAVAVIGDHMWAAMTGLRAAAPRWHDGENGALDSAALLGAMQAAAAGAAVTAEARGDAPAAIARAPRKLDAVYQIPFLAHAQMEPINTTIHVRPDGADLWVGTQVPVRAQNAVCRVTGLKPEQVAVHNQNMGGAFGRRLEWDSVEQAARIARKLAYPVKLVWTREEDFGHDYVRPYYYDKLAAGLDDQGRIAGWHHRVTGSAVVARYAPEGMTLNGRLDPDAVESASNTPYDFPAQLTEYVRHEPAGIATGWWRGVGPTHNVFMVESFIDELAHLAGADPVSFRLRHLANTPRAAKLLSLVAEKSGWGRALPHGTGRGVSVQHAFGSFVATCVQAAVSDKGEVSIQEVHVAVDCGPVVNPDGLEAQVQGGVLFGLSAAMFNEITLAQGRVQQANFDTYRVLRMNETPRVFVHIASDMTAPVGGIGEPGCVSAAPALGNAIFASTGRRLRKLPFAPQLQRTA